MVHKAPLKHLIILNFYAFSLHVLLKTLYIQHDVLRNFLRKTTEPRRCSSKTVKLYMGVGFRVL